MTTQPKIETILPWQSITRDGYAKLDLQVAVDEEFGSLIVRRATPKEEHAGNFIAFHNDRKISGTPYEKRSDALAEAERYFYSLPQFAASSQAKLLNTQLDIGKQAFIRGKSIYDNPNPRTTVNHAQWAAGWLGGHMQNASNMFMQSVEPTIRANVQLESDLNLMAARVQAFGIVLDYMTEISTGAAREVADVPASEFRAMHAVEFITDFRAGDADLMAKKWPGWCDYLAAKRLGPPLDTPVTPNEPDHNFGTDPGIWSEDTDHTVDDQADFDPGDEEMEGN